MTYSSELAAITRRVHTIIVINLDKCHRTSGVSPCLATQTGNDKCYNTFGTCNFTSAYLKMSGGRDYKFSLNEMIPPFPGESILPYLITEPTYLSTKLDPARAITENARVTLKFFDELSNDSKGLDPYFSDRTYYPNAPGTFWRKLKVRNPHYRGRTVTIKQGFHGLAETNYVSRQYTLEHIEINDQGVVQVIIKDLLKKADRAMIPAPTSAVVADDPLTSGATTLNYTLAEDRLGEYPEPSSEGNFYMRIDDEVVLVTDNDRDNRQMTISRGQSVGSTITAAAEHKVKAKMQLCYTAIEENGADMAVEMIEDYIPLDASLINVAGFESERDTWLNSFIFTGIITQPIKVSEALQELQESMGANIWWSEEDQKVKFKVFAPPSPEGAASWSLWTDSANLIKFSIKGNEDERVSQFIVHYNKKVLDQGTKDESYESYSVGKDTESESANAYGESVIKKIHSRWIVSSKVAQTIANRGMARFTAPPDKARATVELKDSEVKTADIVQITTDMSVDSNGNSVVGQQWQVLQKKQKNRAEFDYELMATAFSRRYAYIGPSALADYDAASQSDRDRYGFIGNASNKVGAVSEDGYYIA